MTDRIGTLSRLLSSLLRRRQLPAMVAGLLAAGAALTAEPDAAARQRRARAGEKTRRPGGPRAQASKRCPNGKKKCGGRCVNLKTNPANCGTCGQVCAAPLVCRDGRCQPALKRVWGKRGTGRGQFRFPTGIAVAPDTSVFVADSFNHRLQRFSATGKFLAAWGRFGADPATTFDQPTGVAITDQLPDAQSGWGVWVTDQGHDRVKLFSADGGEKFAELGDTQGSGDGQFDLPTAVTVAALDGRVYVTDLNNHRVQSWDRDGAAYRKWGTFGSGPGQFDSTSGVAEGPDSNIYVADAFNNRIQVFTPTGGFVREWGIAGAGPGQFNEPRGIAFGPDTNVYVVDTGNNRIQVFTLEGTHVLSWGKRGTKRGQFTFPTNIAIGANGIYVTDSDNDRVQQFGFISEPV